MSAIRRLELLRCLEFAVTYLTVERFSDLAQPQVVACLFLVQCKLYMYLVQLGCTDTVRQLYVIQVTAVVYCRVSVHVYM